VLKETHLTLYQYVDVIDYPRNEKGDIQAMIHPQLQARDYQMLNPGDLMFLTFAGRVIPYAGTRLSHQEASVKSTTLDACHTWADVYILLKQNQSEVRRSLSPAAPSRV
jgi:hypothetical protein